VPQQADTNGTSPPVEAANLSGAGSAIRFLWTGFIISILGDHLHSVGLNWVVTQNGGVLSASALGALCAIPITIFGVVGGVVADRVHKGRLLIAIDLIRAALGACAAICAASAPTRVLPYFVIAFMMTIGDALFAPAHRAMLPEIAGEKRDTVVGVDALMFGSMYALQVLGPAIAGFVMGLLPLHLLFAGDALSYVLSAILIRVTLRVGPRLQPPARSRSLDLASFVADAKAGFRCLFSDPFLRPQFTSFAFTDSGYYAFPLLLPAFLQTQGDLNTAHYGLLLATIALGRVTGSVLLARTALKRHRGRVLALNHLLQGLALAAFVLTFGHGSWVSLVCLFLSGLPGGASSVAMSSYMQLEVPREMRARVFAGISVLTTALIPLAIPLFGAIATAVGPRGGIGAIAVLYVVGGLYVAAHRAVWRVS
jgi:MFS family permease